VVPGTGDIATFNASSATVNANTTIDLGAGITIGTIRFVTANAAAYTIGTGAAGSQTLNLDNGGAITMNAAVANNQLFNSALVLGTSAITTPQTFTFTNASTTNSLTMAGAITGFAGTGSRTLAIAGAGNTALTGIIGNGGGTVALTKSGSGTLTLSGANTFTGGLRIDSGTVLATTSGGALGGGNNLVSIAAGANLTFGTANLTYASSMAGAGTINATTLGTGSNSLAFTGNLAGFTGTMNVGPAGGRVRLQSSSLAALSSSATINVLSNGTLGGTLFTDTFGKYDASVFLNGGTTGEVNGQLRVEGGAVWGGNVTLNNTSSVGGTSTGIISGVVSGSFPLTRLGAAGTTVFTNANTYTGTTTVSVGTLQLGNSGTTGSISTSSPIVTNATFAIARSNAVAQGTDFSGAAISGTGGFTQQGTGTTTLSAANTYTGATTVNRGTLKLDFSAVGAPTTNILASNSAPTLAHGTLNLTGNTGATNSQQLGNLTLNAGASRIVLDASGAASLLLTLGTLTRNTGGTADFTLPTGTPSATNGITTTSLNTNGILGAVTVGGTDWAANATNVSGANIVGFSTVGSYTLSSVAGTTAASYSNVNIDVDSSQAPSGVITPNSLRFSAAAANTLTLQGATNTITSGGILVNSSVGSNPSVITGVTLLGASGKDLAIYQNNPNGSLTISAAIANNGTSGVTKSGPGVLTLTGVNTYTGNTTLNEGTLNINNTAAIGNTTTGALVILGGTLDNTSGAAITMIASKASTWNGDFTFTGGSGTTHDLSLTGTATLAGPSGATRTATISAGKLSVGAVAGGNTLNLTKAGAGILKATGGTFGILDIQGGIAQFPGDLTITGLRGTGVLESGAASGAQFTRINTIEDSVFNGVFRNSDGTAGLNGVLGLVKQGPAMLTLAGTGNNTVGDDFQITAGTVRLTGGTTTLSDVVQIGNAANVSGVLRVDGGALTVAGGSTTNIASATNGIGVVNMTSGAITTNTGAINVGSNNTGVYAAFTMSGGTLTSGASLVVGNNSTNQSVLNQSGGVINLPTSFMTLGANSVTSTGVVTLSGGTFTATGTTGGIRIAERGTGVLNVMGTAQVTVANSGINIGPTATQTGWTGIVNLRGGNIITNRVVKGVGTGSATFNFNGGTLTASGNSTTFMGGLDNAYVYGGGGTISDGGFNITITQPLLAPTGNGVNGIASFTGGSGYLDTPTVTVVGDGFGATAIANVANGAVTGITITNPGVGYTATPTFVVFGGGASTPATVTGTAPTANTSGGLTKTGSGTLTLNAASNYSGPTLVSAGTLLLGDTGSVNGSSRITVNGSGAKLVQTSIDPVTAPVTLTTGTLDGTTNFGSVTVGAGTGGIITHGNGTTGPLTIDALTFTGAATINLTATDFNTTLLSTTSLVTGAGPITVNATNANSLWANGVYNVISYSTLGGSGYGSFMKGTVAGLGARQIATLSNPAGFVAITIGGDLPIWTGLKNGSWTTNPVATPKNWNLQNAGTATDFITGDTALFDDTANGTTLVNISDANVGVTSATFNNSVLNYTVSGTGGFGISSGLVVKNGAGMLTLAAANTYAGGTTLNAGTLSINHATALGTGPLSINGGTIDNTSGAPITLTNNNVQIWNTNPVFRGTNSLNLGTAPLPLTVNRTITSNGSGTLTLGGVISGVGFGITKAGSGPMTLAGANTYTGTTVVSGGTLNLTGSINANNIANVGQVTVGTIANQNAGLIISGGTLNATKTSNPSISIAAVDDAFGFLRMSSGALSTTSELHVGEVATTTRYGAFTMTGGTASIGSWLVVGYTNGLGVFNQSGGTLTQGTVSGSRMTIAAGNSASIGVANLSGGSYTGTNGGVYVGENGTGTLNITGNAAVTFNNLSLGQNGNSDGTVNLDGGTLTTNLVAGGAGTRTFNFNGGTLKAGASSATFMQGLTNAYIYSGGAMIDSGAFAITIAQPLVAPTGNGVSATGLTVSGGGYIDTPLVKITSVDGLAGGRAVANIDANGNLTGITITNPGVDYTIPPTFTLLGGGANNTGTVTGTAALVPNVGGGLTKTGTGTLTLTGSSTYTGATTVNAGTLIVGGDGELIGSSVVTVNGSGAKLVHNSTVPLLPAVTITNGTLDGTGVIGSATVASSTGNVVANGNGTTGALTVDSLTFNDAATMNLNVGTTSPSLITTTLNTGVAGGGKITINATNPAWTNNQVYDLISYSALSGAGFSEFLKGTISGLTVRQTSTLTNPAGFVALSIVGSNPVWTGANGSVWTTAPTSSPTSASPNWALNPAHTTTDFWATDTVEFNDTVTVGSVTAPPSTTAVVITGGNVSPGSVTFNNSNVDYTITSSDGLTGIATGSLTKNGTRSVTLGSANTYSGATTINAGTLNLTGSLSSTPITVVSSGTLTESSSGLIAGTASLTTAGATTLSGVNTYTGTTTISAGGTLAIGGAGQLSSVATPGTYAGAIANDGTLTYGSSVAQTLTGIISGTGSLILNGTTNGGPTVAQTPTLTLTAVNTYSGGTTINGGMLSMIGGNNAALGAGTVTINGGNFLFGDGKTVANNFVLSGGGIYAKDGTNTITGTLTINPGSTTSYIGETFDSKIINISGQVFGSGNVTLAHPTVISTTFGGNNVHFSNGNVSTYNGTVTILRDNATDSFTTLFLDASNALGNATINVGDATGNKAVAATVGKPFVFGNGITVATIGGLSSGIATTGFGNVGLVNTASAALTLSVGNNNTNQTFSGILSGAGSLVKIGTGTQTLAGVNTYAGTTAVNAGTVIVSGSLSGSSTVTVGDSAALATLATLGGSGTVGPVFAVGSGNQATTGANIDPGNTPLVAGILNTGAFSATNGAHLSLQIGGTTAGGDTLSGYDRVNVTGDVILSGADLKLSLNGTPAFASDALLFILVNNGANPVAGTFATLNGSSFNANNITLGGQQFQLLYNASFTGTGTYGGVADGLGNDVALLIVVPEPSTLVTLLGGLGVCLGFRRRRARCEG
jgi:autotransporter-associated beta strand protein